MKIKLRDYASIVAKYESVLIEWTERGRFRYKLFEDCPEDLSKFLTEHADDNLSYIMLKPWERLAEIVLLEDYHK